MEIGNALYINLANVHIQKWYCQKMYYERDSWGKQTLKNIQLSHTLLITNEAK